MHKTELKAWMQEHLFYEWQMLHHALWRASTVQRPAQQLDFNAYLESYAIHARVLYEFLTNDKGSGSNTVVANEYVKNFKAGKTDATKGIMQRINRQLTHAGKLRTADESEKVSLGRCIELHNWIVLAMERFTDQLDDDLKNAWHTVALRPASVTVTVGDSKTTTSATNSVTFVQFTPGGKS